MNFLDVEYYDVLDVDILDYNDVEVVDDGDVVEECSLMFSALRC